MSRVSKWNVIGAVALVIAAMLYALLWRYGSHVYPLLLGGFVVAGRWGMRRRAAS